MTSLAVTTTALAVRWNPLDWPLTHGPVPYAVLAAGWAALALLVLSRDRRWLGLRPIGAALLAVAVTGAIKVVVDGWWHPFPEGTPDYVLGWVALAVLALALAGFRAPLLPGRQRFLAAGGAVLVVLMAASQVNRGFDQYPTARVMLAPRTQALTTGKAPEVVTAPAGKVLEEVWRAPAGLPAQGTVSTTPIPGTKSGFDARDAYVYLPPAYQASPRPLLPVLVLMAGQPGNPSDWVNSGAMQERLDAFAADHQGLAPIVVMVDQIATMWGNSLCMDSKVARAQTYLAEDVPDWIRGHLQTATGRTALAIGGASLGGTCALQLAVNAPQVYGSFIDISGQDEPTLGSHGETVGKAFDGDEKAFEAVNPANLMATRQYPETAGVFAVGAGDDDFRPQQETMFAAAQKAGMKVEFQPIPGGHSWAVFREALDRNLPWLGRQTGMIR
ncbi:alpha/beta hydrolase [Kitasatospora sp. NPDC008115]|uniref:alpha/beta hydrolase n=1 Tax=Kitasatospora sp. NPDC008115 TaxID=3364022 RepID=UPI0036EA7A29